MQAHSLRYMPRWMIFSAITCLFVIGPGLMSNPANALTVHDPANAKLLIEQLARQARQLIHQANQIKNQVKQITNQVESLRNQAKMLEDLDVSNYRDAVASMRRLETALNSYCVDADLVPNRVSYGTGFDCKELLDQFRKAYPQPTEWSGQTDEQIARYPEQWNAQKRDAAAKAIQMQNASVESMRGVQERMEQLAEASQRAPGQKAAAQVTNEMLVTLSAQLRDQQAASLALQRSNALREAEEAAWHERNRELIRRVTRDAEESPELTPVRDAFARAARR